MYMVFHIGHRVREMFPLIMVGTAIIDIPKSSIGRVGLGTAGRQQEQGEPPVVDQPLRHGLRLVNLTIVDHDIEPRVPLARTARMKDVQ